MKNLKAGVAMLPKDIEKFFWEYKEIEINIEDNWFCVIERLLEHGDLEACKWMLDNFDGAKLVEVIKTSRNISKKTASMWQNYYALPKEEIRCMNELCQRTDMIFSTN